MSQSGGRNDGDQYKHLFGQELTIEEAVSLEGVRHAVHGMVWSPWDNQITSLDNFEYNPRAAVLMQLRFDGHLGFPGGMVSKTEKMVGLDQEAALEKLTDTLNRESVEEVNMNCDKLSFKPENYLYSQRHDSNDGIVCHFFTTKTSLEIFHDMERRALSAKDFGIETLGHIRVPLYKMHDGYRGLYAFLQNNFIGNSRSQLFRGLLVNNILSLDEVNEANSSLKLKVTKLPVD